MKFREYDNLFVKVFRSRDPENLQWIIEEAATQYNLIDLQYSTTNIDDKGNVEYSALALLQEKNL
ncbi:hypothetical protein J6W34_00950 [bacterium]|nr:hypothetical protein [bacterium]